MNILITINVVKKKSSLGYFIPVTTTHTIIYLQNYQIVYDELERICLNQCKKKDFQSCNIKKKIMNCAYSGAYKMTNDVPKIFQASHDDFFKSTNKI